jgi:hypothetical protein
MLCTREIIEPVIDRINKTLGQENDPTYLAYRVEYTMMKLLEKDSAHERSTTPPLPDRRIAVVGEHRQTLDDF